MKLEVTMQRLGDGLAPALGVVLERLTPLADMLVSLAGRFSNWIRRCRP